jgi:hypothetical protein
MEQDIITLNKISQAQKDKYHIFSHMQNLDFKKDVKVEEGLLEKKGASRRGRGNK